MTSSLITPESPLMEEERVLRITKHSIDMLLNCSSDKCGS